ncbi:MAG: YbdD/YjiX family protein [Lysobacteraceae bacterium]
MSRSTPFVEPLRAAWRWLAQTGRLIVGVPDYDLYVAHLRRRHPDRVPMTREAFFADRVQARYGRGSSRCC